MAMAFEYYLDTDYDFSTSFQKQMAEYLSAEYMDYINEKNLSVEESAVGFDLDGEVSFSLADAASYRTAGAAKSTPGFDVIDYGQEDYVFGDSAADARHWDKYVLKVMEDNSETLAKLFIVGTFWFSNV